MGEEIRLFTYNSVIHLVGQGGHLLYDGASAAIEKIRQTKSTTPRDESVPYATSFRVGTKHYIVQ